MVSRQRNTSLLFDRFWIVISNHFTRYTSYTKTPSCISTEHSRTPPAINPHYYRYSLPSSHPCIFSLSHPLVVPSPLAIRLPITLSPSRDLHAQLLRLSRRCTMLMVLVIIWDSNVSLPIVSIRLRRHARFCDLGMQCRWFDTLCVSQC